MKKKKMEEVVCAKCESSYDWLSSERLVRVLGQEGHLPEEVTVMECSCGHKQQV